MRIFTSQIAMLVFCAWLLASFGSIHAEDPPDLTTEKVLYVTVASHLDTQWNWTIQKTIDTYLLNTLNGNFDRFEDYPNYVLSWEGTFRYKLAKEYYPDKYQQLKNYVEQGRWRVAGSSIDAGDVLVPTPESLMRNILYGNAFFQEEFGKTSVDIFLPDCFGFSYALPSIGAHCGLKGFSSQKLSYGSSISYPFQNIGRWIGPDGKSLVAVIKPGQYLSKVEENLANSTTYLDNINNMYAETGLYVDYRYCGTGDRGGAMATSSCDWLEQSATMTNGDIRVIVTGADQMFRDMTPENVAALPTYEGELLLKNHGTGCYTSHSAMKKWNRRNEQAADSAERAAVIADWLRGGGYPQEKLTTAWERFLWHQFHDDLTGTSVDEAYTFSWNDELLSLNEFSSTEVESTGVLARAMDTSTQGKAIVVSNPLAIDREDLVEALVDFPEGVPTAVRVYDSAGNEVPSQMGTASGTKVRVTFLASVPSVGAAVFDVRPAAAPCDLDTGLSASATQLENNRYRVTIDSLGNVSSIYDKQNAEELLNGPIRWSFTYNLSTRFPAWEIEMDALTGTPSYFTSVDSICTETGPARVGFTITHSREDSTFTQHISLSAGGAGDRVEWDMTVDWGTYKTLAKIEFPLANPNPNATYDLGLGVIQRGNRSSSFNEVPAQQWADLTAADNSYGVTIASDCKYGWDKPNDNILRLTMFHTPEVDTKYVYQANNDIGLHKNIGFAVIGHTGNWSSDTRWISERFNRPLQAFQTAGHSGSLGKTFSFLSVNNPNVMVKAVKHAETSDEIIVRLQELSGSQQTVELDSIATITAARDLTGAEQEIATLSPSGGKLTVILSPHSPRTLGLTLGVAGTNVPAVQSAAVPLTHTLDVVSSDANRLDGDFENGYSYPAEQFPASLTRDGISFQLGDSTDGAANVIPCEGQTIPLNSQDYDSLHILAAATADTTATFSVDGIDTTVTVPHFSDFIGQWKPDYLKKAEVAHVCTHRHTSDDQNEAYIFANIFKFRLAMPAGAGSLTLPNAPDIRLFAVSLAKNAITDTVHAGGRIAEHLERGQLDEPASPGTLAFSASTASVNEDAGTVTLTVTRTGGTAGVASVAFATSDNTAEAGSDYSAAGNTLSWSDGDSTSKDIVIDITNDSDDESDETFTVTLSNASVASLGTPTTATVTIADDDDAGEVSLSVSSVSIDENAGTVSIDVTRTGGTDGAISVDYATSDDTATAGEDYTAASAMLNWANNDSNTQTIVIDILDDAVTEGDETFTLTLSNAANGASIGTATTVVTIVDTSVVLYDPDAPDGTVQGVDYEFHQFPEDISSCDDLTATTLVSEHNDVVAMTEVPGADLDNNGDRYGLIYTGYINAPVDGVYKFYIYSDDGNRMTLHGVTVAADEPPHSPRWSDEKGTLTPIGLKAGRHAFEVRYYENRYDDVLAIEWEGPGLTRTAILATDLYREPDVNTAPVANDDSVTTPEDTPKDITLSATDADGDDLIWNVGTPANGTLSGTAPNVTYTPNSGYSGPDSFTFTVNDGTVDSNTATISVTVDAVITLHDPDAPVGTVQGVDYGFHQTSSGLNDCSGLTASTLVSEHDGVIAMTEAPGTDLDADDHYFGLIYKGYIEAPADGEYKFYIRSDDGNRLTLHDIIVANDESPHGARWSDAYGTLTPIGLKAGRHAFELRFYENKGGEDLEVEWEGPGFARTDILATNLYRVPDSNQPPVIGSSAIANPETIYVDETTALHCSASDPDGDTLTFTWSKTAGPGTVSFTVNGTTDSNDTVLSCDAVGDYTLEVLIEDGNGGTLTSSCNVTVLDLPGENYVAAVVEIDPHDTGGNLWDFFVFRVQNNGTQAITRIDLEVVGGGYFDQLLDDSAYIVTPDVGGGNDSVNSATVQLDFTGDGLAAGGSLNVGDVGGYQNDIDGSWTGLNATVYFADGTVLSGAMTDVGDSDDGDPQSYQLSAESGETPSNTVPVADDDSVTTTQDTPVAITLSATDADGNDLSYNIGTPSNGTLSGTAPNLTYTPDAGYSGPDSFTFTVNDGTVDSNTATVSITVNPTSDFINFNDHTISVYDSGQDGSGGDPTDLQIQNGGNTLYLAGNTWMAVAIPVSVSSGVTIEFEAKSTNAEPEILGIGFARSGEDSYSQVKDQCTQLWGTQNWATRSTQQYDGTGNYIRHSLTISDFTAADDYDRIVFILDHDGPSGDIANFGNVYFRNMRIIGQ